MKILYIQNNLADFRSGCYFYRILLPSIALNKFGHETKFCAYTYKKVNDVIDWADTIVFQRLYDNSVLDLVEYAKKNGKRIAYEIDDDMWNVPKENPASRNKKSVVKKIEEIIKIADVVTTTTRPLAELLKKLNKNVKIIPNALDFTKFNGTAAEGQIPIVLYSGSVTHWVDFLTILPTLKEVQEICPFRFVLQGFCGQPIEVAMFAYEKFRRYGIKNDDTEYQRIALDCYDILKKMDFVHIPFYMPEQYPNVLKNIKADIGICPLKDNIFNKSKSCIKFYEYAANRCVTLAPDLLPYSKEVNYKYKDIKEFKEKLINLLKNKQERQNILKEQRDWVRTNRDINDTVYLWEEAFTK